MDPNEMFTGLFCLFLLLYRWKDRLCTIPAVFEMPAGIALLVDAPSGSVEAWYCVCLWLTTYALLAAGYKRVRWK